MSETPRTWGQRRYGRSARNADELLRWEYEADAEYWRVKAWIYSGIALAAIHHWRREERKTKALERRLRQERRRAR